VSELVGRVLAGRYRLTAPVGIGASAQVYVADDVQLRRRVAVKVLHPGLSHDPTFLRRFQAEAQAAAALNHPNILAVYDWGRDGVPFLVTEYLEGGTLQAVLEAGHRLSLSQALVVGLEAARGLHYAHSRGFAHRDVKPANLLFGDDRRLRVADFGLARALAEAAWTEPEGVVLGTARYVSPEQAAGGSLDGRSDVYSLALVLVEAVTGRVPHTADTPLGSLRARIGRSIEAPAELGPLAPLIEGAGRAEPSRRWSAAELGRALMAAARELPSPEPLPLAPTAVPVSVPTPAELAEAWSVGEVGPFAAPADPTATMWATPAPGPSGAAPSATAPRGTGAAGVDPATAAAVGPAGEAPAGGRNANGTAVPGPPPGRGPSAAPPDPLRPVPPGPGPEAAPDDPPVGLRAKRAGGLRLRRRSARRTGRRGAAAPAPRRAAAPAARARRVGRWVVGLLFLAALATLATIGISLVRGPGAPALVPVPQLVGRMQSEVAALLPVDAEWQVRYEDARRDGTTVGQILGQDPPGGGRLAEGGTLRLTRSIGEELRRVPDLARLPTDQAVARLEAAGLTAGPQQPAYDEEAPAGTVLSATEGGRQLPRGEPVTLVVSQGPAPRPIPDVAGQRPDQATTALQGLGLVVAPTEDYSDEVPAGVVVGTDPATGGQPVPKGSTVSLIVSLGPRPIPVADVVGLPAAEASDVLEAQGFVVRTEGAANRDVIASDPAAGTELQAGSVVFIITRRT
jgi:serine/threonine-protein kinase